MKKISIIIPAHNEEGNIARLLESLLALLNRQNWDGEIVVVDDHSEDNTGKIAGSYKNVSVVYRKNGKKGMGLSLRAGTEKAKGEIVIWTMADRSDNLETIPAIVKKIDEDYDLVLASRYMKGGSRGELSLFKAFLSSRFSVLCRWFFGITQHDLTNAFRGFRKEVFDKITLKSEDFTISPEFALKAYLQKFKVSEVPTDYFNRKAGKTKFKIVKMTCRYMFLLLRLKVKGI